MATAHPAKDYQPIEKIIKNKVQFPTEIEQLFTKEQKSYKIVASQKKIEKFIAENIEPRKVYRKNSPEKIQYPL